MDRVCTSLLPQEEWKIRSFFLFPQKQENDWRPIKHSPLVDSMKSTVAFLAGLASAAAFAPAAIPGQSCGCACGRTFLTPARVHCLRFGSFCVMLRLPPLDPPCAACLVDRVPSLSPAALRPADQRQASTAVRITKFGYPCSEGRGLIEADEKQAAKQNKLEGWLYRYVILSFPLSSQVRENSAP